MAVLVEYILMTALLEYLDLSATIRPYLFDLMLRGQNYFKFWVGRSV